MLPIISLSSILFFMFQYLIYSLMHHYVIQIDTYTEIETFRLLSLSLKQFNSKTDKITDTNLHHRLIRLRIISKSLKFTSILKSIINLFERKSNLWFSIKREGYVEH